LFPLTLALSLGERENGWQLFVIVTLCDQDLRMNVAVGALGFGDDVDAAVDEVGEIWIIGDCECRASSFQPFVEVAVVKGRAAMAAFGEASSNAEILEELTVVGAQHDAPEAGNGLGPAGFEPSSPEAVSPADFVGSERLKGRREGKKRNEGEEEDRKSKLERREEPKTG
jgi:hypothetical protein